ncbi:glutathione hydrolase 1 proenzyme-like isoform X2 [Lineus longissimus]|uniref:glutathione hydrolase 1 proenzyme-like isoform X2 n=1 Tax=Lineus longissimus TaxID=88925 RepID=UPI002B4EA53D
MADIYVREMTGDFDLYPAGPPRRKISYAIQPKEIDFRRKKRLPQIVGLAAFFIIALVLTVGLVFGIGPSDGFGKNNSTHYDDEQLKDGECVGREGTFRFAAVTSDEPSCSSLGAEMLGRYQGTAVDAAIATLLCVGVVQPHSMGLGGGFVMTIYDRPTKKIFTLDARETAPGQATEEMFGRNKRASKEGGLSIGVPGELKGYWEAHKRFGRVPWSTLFKQAIDRCENGVKISKTLYSAMKLKECAIKEDDGLRKDFVDPTTGELLREGETFTRATLGRTLRLVSERGAEIFYNGSLAKDIVMDVQEAGGIITESDLANYKVKWREPIEVTFKDGTRFHSLPAPSSGPVLAFMLNVLDGYNFSSKTAGTVDSISLAYHQMIETFKFGYAHKPFLGDKDFVDVSKITRNLTSRPYASYIRSLILNDKTHDITYYGPLVAPDEDSGTGGMTVLSPTGDAVAVSSTINMYFGSQVLGTRSGIIFNNVMNDFSKPGISNVYNIPQSDLNYIKPGKRPVTSMSPAIFLDKNGDIKLLVTGAGGNRVLSSLAYVASRVLWFHESLQKAISSPRIHDQWIPPNTNYEKYFPSRCISILKTKGHTMTLSKAPSIVQAISRQGDMISSYADQRNGGCVDGY